MYIGVHTPLDVVVSIGIALFLIFVLQPLFFGNRQKAMLFLLGGMLLLAVGYLCFVTLFPFPGDVDLKNYASGVENAYTLLGALIGMLIVYIVDERWLHFKTNAVWWAQVLKVVFGLLLVLAVKSGTKPVLNMLFGDHIGRSVRYSLVVVTAGVLWPLTFRWFAKLGSKE